MAEYRQLRPNLSVTPLGRERLGRPLESWKEIASYLNRSEKTVRRWEEREGLPIHRLLHEKRGTVYAYTSELNDWRRTRQLHDEVRPESPDQKARLPLIENPVPGGEVRPHPKDRSPGFDVSAPFSRAVARWWVWILIALPGIAAVIYGTQGTPKHETSPLTVAPLTSYPGNELQPNLSPDGNQVAFAFRGGSSNYNIYVKVIGSEEIVRLTSAAADDLSPSWSPDGQSIVFLRFISDQSALVIVIPSVGGPERQLAKVLIDRTEGDIRATWSPDGEWIATSEAETPLSPMRLVLIAAATGEKRKLVYHPAAVEGDVSPSFSPDGRYLAFARHISPVVADIYVLELPRPGFSSAEARRLTDWNRLNRNPIWTGDGRDILFVGDDLGLGQRIWRIPAFHAADARPVDRIGEGSSSIALSSRKNRLVYAKETEDPNIWRISFDRASAAQARYSNPSSSRLIASTRVESQPQYSPDGKNIAYHSDRAGDYEIWVANSDGSAARQLTHLHAKMSGYPRWSPDGRYIVFHSRPSGYANLYIIEVETGAYRQLTTGTGNDTAPSWSHDGKWIYFCSEREDGPQIWRAPANGGPAFRLTKTGGAQAFDSIDGMLLFFSKFTEPGLWVLPLHGGVESQILPSLYSVDTFAVTKRGIYFMRHTADEGAMLSFMSFSPQVVQDLARVKSSIGDGLTVSPDGSSILYAQIDQAGSDLYLVENFN